MRDFYITAIIVYSLFLFWEIYDAKFSCGEITRHLDASLYRLKFVDHKLSEKFKLFFR